MTNTQRISFTVTSLCNALAAVRGIHDMRTELIVGEVFRQVSELAATSDPLKTIWCGHAGLYRTTLEAIANGEQVVAPAIIETTATALDKNIHAVIPSDRKENNA